jgi:folate-dependent phosphoribosylglycinamide formyltransferase PurN
MRIGLLMSPAVSDFRKNTLRPILADTTFKVVMALIDDRPEKSAWQRLKNNLRRGRGGYVIIMAFKRFFASKIPQEDSENYCDRHGIAVHRTVTPYGEDTLTKVKASELDVLVLVDGFGIVKKGLINAVPLGVISYHHGNMRRYRGMPPAMWELYNGETEMGITVQLLSVGLDNGRPIIEKTIAIEPNDDVDRLTRRALKESERMLYAALKELVKPGFVAPIIKEFGKVYTLPNLSQWLFLQVRIIKNKLFKGS